MSLRYFWCESRTSSWYLTCMSCSYYLNKALSVSVSFSYVSYSLTLSLLISLSWMKCWVFNYSISLLSCSFYFLTSFNSLCTLSIVSGLYKLSISDSFLTVQSWVLYNSLSSSLASLTCSSLICNSPLSYVSCTSLSMRLSSISFFSCYTASSLGVTALIRVSTSS